MVQMTITVLMRYAPPGSQLQRAVCRVEEEHRHLQEPAPPQWSATRSRVVGFLLVLPVLTFTLFRPSFLVFTDRKGDNLPTPFLHSFNSLKHKPCGHICTSRRNLNKIIPHSRHDLESSILDFSISPKINRTGNLIILLRSN